MKAILFAGQGSQQIEMGKDFYEEKEFSKKYYDDLDPELKNLILNGDLETLSQTKNTQPAMIAFQTMISELLKNEGIEFDYAAGLSIGEYAALSHSGVLNSKEAIEIAKTRGKLMDEVGKGLESSMIAVLGMEKTELEKYCKEATQEDSKVEISNLNCPGQIVVSGDKNAIERLKPLIEDKARRLIPLNTSGPFHTSYMESVEKELEKLFENYEFKDEKTKVVYNLLGTPADGENIKEIMAKQVSHTVDFQGVIEYLVAQGVDTFVEVGFGGVLKGFVRKVDKKLKVYTIDSVSNYEEFLKEVADGQ